MVAEAVEEDEDGGCGFAGGGEVQGVGEGLVQGGEVGFGGDSGGHFEGGIWLLVEVGVGCE